MDSAEAKFHATVVSLLVFPLVFGVVKLAPVLSTLPWLTLAAGTVATALASAGVYRLLSMILMHILRKNERLKRFILGRAYLHGTWVGWFIGHNNDVRYLVEVFEQDLSGVKTRGMSFTEAGDKHGEWSSEATLIDHTQGKFLYTCDVQILRAGGPLQERCAVHIRAEEPERSSPRP